MQVQNKEKQESLAAFAHRIGILAGRARLRQVAIARHLRVTPQRVGSWFQGKNFPGGDVEHALAALLGTSKEWLIEGKESPDNKESTAAVSKDVAPYGEKVDLIGEIERHHQTLLLAAKGDAARLGWIREQQRAHLTVPSHWVVLAPLVVKARKTKRERGPGITQVDDPAARTPLSTHTGLPINPPYHGVRAG